MKFAEHLSSHLTPEWRKQYVQYEHMKTMLYAMFDGLAPGTETDDEIRRRHLMQKEETFFKFCADELNKINLFFNQKMAEAQTKFRDLNREIDVLQKIAQSKTKKERQRTVPIINRLNIRRNANDEKTLLTSTASSQTSSSAQMDEKIQPKTLRELKTAFAEFYLSLVLLQNYQQLNCTGFRKILKKHDKLLTTESGGEWFQQNVEHAAFVDNKEIDTLISNTEKAVTDNLESGNRQAAMKRLRVPPLSEAQNAWTTFRLGFFLGSFLVLCFLILLTVLLQHRPEEPRWVGVRLFRGFFILFANLFFMGINMYGWQSSGVNHVLIFEIDPRDHLTYQSLMEISSFFLMTWALCVLGYLHATSLHIPLTPFPLILLFVTVLWLINPLPIMAKSARYWFIKHTFYCFSAPFHFVTFPDFWLADQMNSLVTFFLDMEYLTCFYTNYVDYADGMKMIVKNTWAEFSTGNDTMESNYTSGITYHASYGIDAYSGADMCMSNIYGIRPIISCLPALIRFLQCLRRYRDTKHKHPHLTNAGKYATTFFVVIFGSLNTYYKRRNGDNAFFYIWIFAYVISFMYTYTWDIKMDWGLLDNSANTDKLLRDELIYDHKGYYYAAMVEDFVLRLAWVMNVSLGDAWSTEADLLMFITAPLECLRRFIWNYFRLENEHVNNCGNFRAIRDIHVAPISRHTDWDDMENKMDKDDGVEHRGGQYQQLKDKKLKNRSRKSVIRRKIVQKLRPGGGSALALFPSVGSNTKTKRHTLFPRHNSLFVAASASSSRSALVKLDYPSIRNPSAKDEQRPGLKNILEPLGAGDIESISNVGVGAKLLSPETAIDRGNMERKKTIFTLHETDDVEPLTPKASITSHKSPSFERSDSKRETL